MATLIFVHGTGVREQAYNRAFDFIRDRLAKLGPQVELRKCCWGDVHGAALHLDGKSIPYYETRSLSQEQLDPELRPWALLYSDPLLEVRLLAVQSNKAKDLAPGQRPPWIPINEALQGLVPDRETEDMLCEYGLNPYWEDAYLQVVHFEGLPDALANAPFGTEGDGYNGVREILARAIVAGIIQRALEADTPLPVAATRNLLVSQISVAMGAETVEFRGMTGDLIRKVSAPLLGLAAYPVTWAIKRHRHKLFKEYTPVPGDVLVYQARGESIRAFIRKIVEAATQPVYILAHSLGGIASVGMLASPNPPPVEGLVTVGSQAPFLYEIDALPMLPLSIDKTPDERLPPGFPRRWLNFYDPNDFLAMPAKAVFGSVVEDVEVNSGEPFPISHWSYWDNDLLFNRLAAFIE